MNYYVVDAFTDHIFGGNPAGILVLDAFLPDEKLQAIAAENYLPETAFVVPTAPGSYQLRWFTPAAEVSLCGHGTVATAHVVATFLEPGCTEMDFSTKSGVLHVQRQGDWYELAMPVRSLEGPALAHTAPLEKMLGARVVAATQLGSLLVELESEAAVAALRPDTAALKAMEPYSPVIVTAPATTPGVDFVSRFFNPRSGVEEDPVTGSAHTYLVPFWAARLGKTELEARQLSARQGHLRCRLAGDTVYVSGQAALYAQGDLCLQGVIPAPQPSAITVLITYSGQGDSARLFAQEMEDSGLVAAIRQEDGNLQYTYFFPKNDPHALLLVDSWRDQNALDAHHASPMMAAIARLREKYDLHMQVARYVSDDQAVSAHDASFIRH